MTFLTVCAYDLTDEFVDQILKEYQVTIKDRSDEPLAVVFEGGRDQLIAMFNKGWANGESDEQLSPSSPWLTEVFVVPENNNIQKNAVGPIAVDGAFSGLVLDVSDGFVIQKINRDGNTVRHELSALSGPVVVGSVVDIGYANGVGVVGGKGAAVGVER